MKFTEWVYLLFTHPNEVRALLQYGIFTDFRDLKDPKDVKNTGWDRESMRKCWEFLDLTSRSFSAVIKELEGDLARTVCLFYLVLRGLDTVEDDMTLPVEVKQQLLLNFHKELSDPEWRFTGSGPDEKDRAVLIEFFYVNQELALLPKEYYDIIADICRKMGKGMADFADRSSEKRSFYVETISEYDLYCHYVAGLVGEGLSRLFSASKKESDWLADQLELSNSCGMLLQKTNITRDFREDVDQGRFFWPREIWGALGFADMKELTEPANEQRALFALSGMTLDALRHVPDALDYLTLLHNQSIFNFVAIPDVMAMATLALVFMNRDVLHKNVKISRGIMVQLIQKSTNPRDVAYIFRDYARKIHAKSIPDDPNFVKISVACGKIEQWAEHHYPSFISVVGSGDSVSTGVETSSGDARVRVIKNRKDREVAASKAKVEAARQAAIAAGKMPADGYQDNAPLWLIPAMIGATLLIFGGAAGIAFLVLWYFDLLH